MYNLCDSIELTNQPMQSLQTLSSPYLRCGRPVQHLQQQKVYVHVQVLSHQFDVQHYHFYIEKITIHLLLRSEHFPQRSNKISCQSKDGGEAKDLRSRGLCLVPLTSTTYAVASETAPEFWPPTFGGTFR